MARGKNYVNQNKGMTLQGGNKKATSSANVAKVKKSSVVETCFYGSGCTRKDCIYRHPSSSSSSLQQQQNVAPIDKSEAPCKPFLAGMCSFNAITCNKRHVTDPIERERLLQQYAKTPCRHGTECKQIDTGGCLYSHNIISEDDCMKLTKPFPQKGMMPPLPMNGFLLPPNPHCSLVSDSPHFVNNNKPSPAIPGSSLRVALPTGMMHQQLQQQQSSTTQSPPMLSAVSTTSQQPAGLRNEFQLTSSSRFSSLQQPPTGYHVTATQQFQQQQQHRNQSLPYHQPYQHHLSTPTHGITQHPRGYSLSTPLRKDGATVNNTINNEEDFPPLTSLSITSSKPNNKQQHQQSVQASPSNSGSTKTSQIASSKFNVNAQEFRPGGW